MKNFKHLFAMSLLYGAVVLVFPTSGACQSSARVGGQELEPRTNFKELFWFKGGAISSIDDQSKRLFVEAERATLQQGCIGLCVPVGKECPDLREEQRRKLCKILEGKESWPAVFPAVLRGNLGVPFTFFIFDGEAGWALTAAHAIRGKDMVRINYDGSEVECRSHPCYRADGDRPVAWDLALCASEKLKSLPGASMPSISLAFEKRLRPNSLVDVIGYGCNQSRRELRTRTAQANLSPAVLRVTDQLGVHGTMLKLEAPPDRETVVCEGDSGGPALARFDSVGEFVSPRSDLDLIDGKSVAFGVISKNDDDDFSYISLIDGLTRKWFIALREDWNLNSVEFRVANCPDGPGQPVVVN